VKSAPPIETNPAPKEKANKKCSSLEYESTFNVRQKGREPEEAEKEQGAEGGKDKAGYFERRGHLLKQKLATKSDSCNSASSSLKKNGRKIGIFKEKCLEMADMQTIEPLAPAAGDPEKSTFLDLRRGLVAPQAKFDSAPR
jgi:hypothetical protein